jgi:broad specificity phosphatase PhoE
MKLVLLALCFISIGALAAPNKIILLRHAEKQAGKDPSLTDSGKQRAIWLAGFLSEYQPAKLFSTDYKRTKETLAPLAKKQHITVLIYNPRELEVFADKLKKLNGTIVVVGHSNTTPKLAGLLTNEKYKQFDEKEFDSYFEIKRIDTKYIARLKTMSLK